MSEKLSALIDNELSEFERAEVLRDLGRDVQFVGLWSRYHMIGLAMRREQVVPNDALPERVARQLAEHADGSAGGGRDAQPRKSLFRIPGGFSVAASVIGVLLLGTLAVQLYGTGGAAPGQPSAANQVALDTGATRWEGVDPATVDALNALLIEHGEFTSASGMNGLTAYTKFVAYDSR